MFIGQCNRILEPYDLSIYEIENDDKTLVYKVSGYNNTYRSLDEAYYEAIRIIFDKLHLNGTITTKE